MRTYTVSPTQQRPGHLKSVLSVSEGIEVVEGAVLRGSVVSLGSPENCWEVPLMMGNFPFVNGEGMTYDCHPVPVHGKKGRFLLAKPDFENSSRILVRINTMAGTFGTCVGSVTVKDGGAKIGYAFRENSKGIRSEECLVDVRPGAKIIITVGGTIGEQYELTNDNGSVKFAEIQLVAKTQPTPKPVEPKATPKTVSAPKAERPVEVSSSQLDPELERALERVMAMSPEEVARLSGGRLVGKSAPRPCELVAA
jgi:hypothetical protein